MMNNEIIIKNASHHNLKDIEVHIPKRKMTVVTGVSGSGKSTLVYDVLYATAHRKYVDTMPYYIRKYIQHLPLPEVGMIYSISPAVALSQTDGWVGGISEVGTITEIVYYLRVLYTKIGQTACPFCNHNLNQLSAEQIVNILIQCISGEKIIILSNISKNPRESYELLLEKIRKLGFQTFYIEGKYYSLDQKITIDESKKLQVFAVIDKVTIDKKSYPFLVNIFKKAQELGTGLVKILIESKEGKSRLVEAINNSLEIVPMCPEHLIYYGNTWEMMFSPHSVYGQCPICKGRGKGKIVEAENIIKDSKLSINQGALLPEIYNPEGHGRIQMIIYSLAVYFDIDMDCPLKDISKNKMELIFYGTHGKEFILLQPPYFPRKIAGVGNRAVFDGFVNKINREYMEYIEINERKTVMDNFYKKVMKDKICQYCNGKKYKEESLNVKINDCSIYDIGEMTLESLFLFIDEIKYPDAMEVVIKPIITELKEKINSLIEIGLEYISLNMESRYLSGGEMQRIRLCKQINSKMAGLVFILDEPSTGLHPKDIEKLIIFLKKLTQLGNTVIVIEHDKEIIECADYILEVGPGAGILGGRVIAQGSLKDIKENKDSLTGKYLKGEKYIALPKKRRVSPGSIKIEGAKANNLKCLNVSIPLKVLTCITGVSGSGKSSLIKEVIVKAYQRYKKKLGHTYENCKKIEGFKQIDDLIYMDQSPVGIDLTSNIATYLEIYQNIRKKFASVSESVKAGFKIGDFALGIKNRGRCPECKGTGIVHEDMLFMGESIIECPNCNGKKFMPALLEIKYKQKSIYDVLNMTIVEAIVFFQEDSHIVKKLKLTADIGLGYLKLGQATSTLSGGEAQRIKLAYGMESLKGGNCNLYILDEPTKGLHIDDIAKLLNCLNLLVNAGHTILLVEHHLEVIKCADYLIDLGPEGGKNGGFLIGEGTPEELSLNKVSYTGICLKTLLKETIL